jgi:hypothetical protein
MGDSFELVQDRTLLLSLASENNFSHKYNYAVDAQQLRDSDSVMEIAFSLDPQFNSGTL